MRTVHNLMVRARGSLIGEELRRKESAMTWKDVFKKILALPEEEQDAEKPRTDGIVQLGRKPESATTPYEVALKRRQEDDKKADPNSNQQH